MVLKKISGLWLGALWCTQLFSQNAPDTVQLKEFDVVNTTKVALPAQKAPKRIDETLTQIQGVSLIKRGNYAAEPVFRGLNGGQMSLTIDGMRIFSACTDKMDPISSYVASNNLESISVTDNTNEQAMGSSIGGAINFSTKQPQINAPNKFIGNLSQHYNSNTNGTNTNLAVVLSDSLWAVGVNGNYQKFGNYHAGGGKEINYTQFEKVNVAVNATAMLSPTSTLKAQFIYDDAYNVGYAALPMDVSFAGGRIYALSYKKYFKTSTIKIKAYGNNITHVMDDSKRPDVPIRMDMPGKSNTYGIFAKTEFKPHRKHHLVITPDYYFNQSFADMTMYPNDTDRPNEPAMYMITWPDVFRHSASLQATDHIHLNDANQLHVDLKYEYVTSQAMSEFGRKQMASLGFDGNQPSTYHLTSGGVKYIRTWKGTTSATFNVGFAERQPTVSEGFGYYLFNSQDAYDYIGVPDLNKEQAVKLNASVQTLWRETTIKGGVYHYQFNNYILGIVNPELDGMTIGSKGVKVYENLPNASISGVELTLNTQVWKKLKVSNTASYTYGIDHKGNPLPLIPPLKNLTLLRLNVKKYMLHTSVILAASQSAFNADAGEQYTPSYGVMNIGVSKLFPLLKQQANIGVEANNIFDSYYWDHMDWNNIPRVGRSINVFFSIQF